MPSRPAAPGNPSLPSSRTSVAWGQTPGPARRAGGDFGPGRTFGGGNFAPPRPTTSNPSSGASGGWRGGKRWQTINSAMNAIGENSQARRAGISPILSAMGGSGSVLSKSTWKSFSRNKKDALMEQTSRPGLRTPTMAPFAPVNPTMGPSNPSPAVRGPARAAAPSGSAGRPIPGYAFPSRGGMGGLPHNPYTAPSAFSGRQFGSTPSGYAFPSRGGMGGLPHSI